MVRDFLNYDVFISSPSDVTVERDIVQEAIEQINQIIGEKDGVRLNPIRWENDVSSQFGGHPQKIVNEQIGDEYDIFIGILCSRFGQATQSYDSGTEEEFFRAYERFNEAKSYPEILFYFKDPRKSELAIDAGQLLKVSEFKKKISNIGIYEDFDSPESLKTKVIAALVKALDRLQKNVPKTRENRDSNEKPAIQPTDSAMIKVSDFDDDTGIMELTEMVFTSMKVVENNMESIQVATGKLGEKLKARTDEMKKLHSSGDVRKDQRNARVVVEKVAAEMQRYCNTLDQYVPDARKEFLSALRCMEHAVIISHQDGVSDHDEVKVLADGLERLRPVLVDLHDEASRFLEAVSAWPRVTSKLNQAKRRTANSISDLQDFLSEASANIDVTLESIMQ